MRVLVVRVACRLELGEKFILASRRKRLTCTRLLFRTDTNDLAGGVRRGKGAMVTSHTCFVLK